MALTRALERALTSLGFWRAIGGIPGLLLVMVFCIGGLEVLAADAPPALSDLAAGRLHRFTAGLGAVLGLFGYLAGQVWDSVIFDPLYSLSGRWLIGRRPLLIFPRGSALRDWRARGEQLLPVRFLGESAYGRAERILKMRPRRWKAVEAPLALSRFVRSFIWPSLIVTVGCLVGVLGARFRGWPLAAEWLLPRAAATFAIAVLLCVPYLHLRVEHLTRLYESAVNLVVGDLAAE